MTIPTYPDLEPVIRDWAVERELIHPDGTPHKATPLSQHRKTLEEIGEAQLELRKLAKTKAIADRLINRLGCNSLAALILKRRRHRLALELGDILVTLAIQSAMQGSMLEECLRRPYIHGKPLTWQFVDHWAEGLGMGCSIEPVCSQDFTRMLIGAIVLCVEDDCRIQLSMMGPECLALALAKISGRHGEVVDGVFVKS